MVGYVVLLISFPVEMSQWASPQTLMAGGQALPSFSEAMNIVFAGNSALVDGYTGATPLDLFKNQQGLMVEQIVAEYSLFNQAMFAGVGWEWVNLGFLAGGIYLLYKRAFTWHAPISMLAALLVMSVLFYDFGSSSSGGSPWLHLLSGSTMLGAFFIITDPVSSAVSNKGRVIYGAGVGILIVLIRVHGLCHFANEFCRALYRLLYLASNLWPQKSRACNTEPRAMSLPKSIQKNSLLLLAFALVTAGLLAATNEATKEKIAEAERRAAEKALLEIVPAERIDNDLLLDTITVPESAWQQLGLKEGGEIHLARKNNEIIAMITTTVAADGYSGDIKMLTGVNRDGSVAGVRVISHSETPGLGDKIDLKKSDWITLFEGLSLQNPSSENWTVKKDGGEFDQFTGATITPRAVVNQVKNVLLFVEDNRQLLFNTSQ